MPNVQKKNPNTFRGGGDHQNLGAVFAKKKRHKGKKEKGERGGRGRGGLNASQGTSFP